MSGAVLARGSFVESTSWRGRGPRSRGGSRPGLAPGVVRHVERDSGRFVVWHVEAAADGSPVSPNYKTNAAHFVIIQLADVRPTPRDLSYVTFLPSPRLLIHLLLLSCFRCALRMLLLVAQKRSLCTDDFAARRDSIVVDPPSRFFAHALLLNKRMRI